MKEDIQSMEEDLNMRLIKEQKFRKTTAKKLKKHFNAYMKTRGHQGGIAIDFEKKTLEFDVILKGTNVASAEGDRPKKRAKKDTKTLSGGERAFMTVAFLLALGEAMECPFRGMDEFDCFMDAANRNVSIKQLIGFAKNQGHRQFIFLTPLSLTKAITDLSNDPKVGIWQLTKDGVAPGRA